MFKDISRSLLAAFLITIYWMASACSVKVVHYWVGKSAKTKRSIFLSSTPRIVHYAAAFTPILLTAFLLSPLAVSCQVIKTQKTVEVEQIEWIDEVVLRQHFAFPFVILVALVQQVRLHSRWSHRLPLAPYAYRYYRLMLYSHSTHHRHHPHTARNCLRCKYQFKDIAWYLLHRRTLGRSTCADPSIS